MKEQIFSLDSDTDFSVSSDDFQITGVAMCSTESIRIITVGSVDTNQCIDTIYLSPFPTHNTDFSIIVNVIIIIIIIIILCQGG
jgi:hypothetical protein